MFATSKPNENSEKGATGDLKALEALARELYILATKEVLRALYSVMARPLRMGTAGYRAHPGYPSRRG